jgi:hypothetical protein
MMRSARVSSGVGRLNKMLSAHSILSAAGLLLCVSLGACDTPSPARAAGAYEEEASPESLSDFTLRWLFGVGMGRKLTVERLEFYYVEPVTEQQARAAGQFLSRLGLAERPALVQLRKNTEASPQSYELRIGTPYSRTDHIDREMRTVYQLMALSAEGALFDGAPVQVSLCNGLLQPLLILRPRLKPQPAGEGRQLSIR